MAQGGLQAAVKLYEGLKQEWGKKPADLDKCGQILAQLKIALLGLSFLPSDASKPSKQELLLAREVLEVGAQWSIRRKDIPSFERYMAQLKPYYLDYGRELPQSAYAYQMLGLNLLRLLAQNRIAEFHSEIELVDPKELLSNIYLKHPIALEQYLMEGSYNKVFLARGNVPADSYAFFMDILMGTIRSEIADCSEKAYARIPVDEAKTILYFDKAEELSAFASERGWRLVDRAYVFESPEKPAPALHSGELLRRCLNYARELEQIV